MCWVLFLTNPRQRVADEHVYHAGSAKLRVHQDHTGGLFAHLAYDLGFLAAFHTTQSFEGGVG